MTSRNFRVTLHVVSSLAAGESGSRRMVYGDKAIAEAIVHAVHKLGYEKLHSQQEMAVKNFLAGNDVFVCLPTGSGKSLCYCLLPAAFDYLRSCHSPSIVVVVSPLIALMKDQVRAMNEREVRAVFAGEIKEGTPKSDDVLLGKYQLIFISPEAVLSENQWRDTLLSPVYQKNLVALVVDEAHCVKKWGDTFRRAFAELGEVRSLVPKSVRMMALTATATKQTRNSICRTLGLKSPVIIAKLPNRPNIKYVVHGQPGSIEEEFKHLAEEIRTQRTKMGRTIIYCRSYDSCAMIYLFLKTTLKGEVTEPVNSRDLAVFRLVDMFTACTLPAVKEQILESFCSKSGNLRVIVATVAFGMGVDCPDVRKVIHWSPSEDVEQYLQETGRAGRDGKDSVALLYVADLVSSPADPNMKEYYKNTTVCRRQFLLKSFELSGDYESSDDGVCKVKCCDVCEITCMCPLCTHY